MMLAIPQESETADAIVKKLPFERWLYFPLQYLSLVLRELEDHFLFCNRIVPTQPGSIFNRRTPVHPEWCYFQAEGRMCAGSWVPISRGRKKKLNQWCTEGNSELKCLF